MKELNRSTVEMLKSKRSVLKCEMKFLEDGINYLDEQIKELRAQLDKNIDEWNEKNDICTDICELIGYEEES